MTATLPAVAAFSRSRSDAGDADRHVSARRARRRRAESGAPRLSPKLQMTRSALLALLALSAGLLLQLSFVSAMQHGSARQQAFDRFRSELAEGTAPIGPTDYENRVLDAAAPVALLEIPTIGLSEVVGQGTTASDLFVGPGHRRDTPLPGQIGVSLLFGRRAAYGGPFRDIGDLVEGDLISVTTGQGSFEYRVLGVRRAGDPLPEPLAPGSSRLVLATADGRSFLPSGVLRVDADISGTPVGGPARLLTDDELPAEERLMAADRRTLWVLVLWLQALIAISISAVWAWHRWGRAQTWIVFLPPLALVGLATAGEAARLLPNLT